jgi:hypothetical protein
LPRTVAMPRPPAGIMPCSSGRCPSRKLLPCDWSSP